MNREHRNLLLDGQLVLISPFDPSAGFNVGHAMQRNKLVYALADASLVVSSDLNKGGTWTGAVEQLDKLNFVPVYVRSTGKSSPGLDALRSKGARPWPNPEDANSLGAVFKVTSAEAPADRQAVGALFAREPKATTDNADLLNPPTDALFEVVRKLLRELLHTPKKDREVAAALDVSPSQAKAWLERLVDEGVLEKRKRPVGYVVKQNGLFE